MLWGIYVSRIEIEMVFQWCFGKIWLVWNFIANMLVYMYVTLIRYGLWSVSRTVQYLIGTEKLGHKSICILIFWNRF